MPECQPNTQGNRQKAGQQTRQEANTRKHASLGLPLLNDDGLGVLPISERSKDHRVAHVGAQTAIRLRRIKTAEDRCRGDGDQRRPDLPAGYRGNVS